MKWRQNGVQHVCRLGKTIENSAIRATVVSFAKSWRATVVLHFEIELFVLSTLCFILAYLT